MVKIMKKNFIRLISILCLAAVMISVTFTTAIATTVYYYFGYLYTYLNNDMVSLYGIDNEEFDVVFIPDTLNERKLVDIRNNAFKDNTDIRLIDSEELLIWSVSVLSLSADALMLPVG